MSSEIATVGSPETRINIYDKITDPIAAAEKLGAFIFKSGMFGCQKPEQGNIIALACMCERKNPIEIARTYHIIQGKLSMRADAMLAELKSRGGKYKIISRTSEKAEIEISYDGNKQKFSFTWEEAQKEPFVWATKDKDGKKIPQGKSLKDNWATPRARMQMLWARVGSDGIRAVAPEIVAGIYTPEEVDSFNTDSTPDRSKAEADQRREELQRMNTEAESPSVIEADYKPVESSQPEPQPTPVAEANGKVTIDQLNEMAVLSESLGTSKEDFVANVRSKLNVNSPAELTLEVAEKLIAGLENQLKKKSSQAA